MQLLVFAHTPPPIHGQSLMVQTLVEGLPGVAPDIKLFHVNPRLSRGSSDIGRWRPAKLLSLIRACFHAWSLRVQHGPMVFYYVPAPGKRGALYRDWIVMLLCRPFFSALVLHWHAVGLGEWLAHQATALERGLTKLLLGNARLSIVLAEELVADVKVLNAIETVVVANGIDVMPHDSSAVRQKAATLPDWPNTGDASDSAPTEILYLGLGSREKGLFDLLTALAIANRRGPGEFRLTVAGGFAHVTDQHAFFSQALALGPNVVRHVGFANAALKEELFAAADVFCFPTSYPHEGQPLVLIEALAHDVPIITTRWRAIPGMLPKENVWLVESRRPDQLAVALAAARAERPSQNILRSYYFSRFTRERHLTALAAALSTIKKD